MTRTNAYILIAVALLGILLLVMQGIFDQVPVTEVPPEPARADSGKSGHPAGTGVPRIGTYQDLLRFLNAKSIDGRRVIEDSAQWFQARGFLGPDELLGVSPEAAPAGYYESLDENTLHTMSAGGDMGATQALASRIVFSDPFAARDLYARAARLGSVEAMLQTASLLETFGDIRLDEFNADEQYRRRIQRLRPDASSPGFKLQAFQIAFTAVRDGGRPVAQPEIVRWLQAMAASLSAESMIRACKLSEQKLISRAASRRLTGLEPVSTEPPPVFLGDLDLEHKLPCRNTPYSYYPVLNLDNCTVEPVEDAAGQPRHLYICLGH